MIEADQSHLIIGVIILVALFIVLFYLIGVNVHKTKKIRLQVQKEIEIIFPNIMAALQQFEQLSNFKNGYFNNFKLQLWKSRFVPIMLKLEQIPYHKLKSDQKKVEKIKLFLHTMAAVSSLRETYNTEFVANEIMECQDFFDNIEGRKLDNQQRKAIVTDEDNNLIVAGAGSGKTTTIIGKVIYLINRFQIDPKEILLVAFTRKACDDMRRRIKKRMKIDIDVMTFHKLGKEIIAKAEQDQPSIFDETKLTDLINSFIKDLMKNERYLNQINTYFIEYLKPYKDDNEFESHGEYIQFIKDQNIRCFRTKEKNINGRITLQREYCKSTEEVMIANYLFLNNIIYEYERPYEIKTSDSKYSQYKPDFYLPEYHIYIEHFAIDRNGNAPRWFSAGEGLSPSEKYNRDMEFKQLTHKVFKTTLVETYSYEKKEGILLQNLQSKLRAKGVVFVPKSANEIWKIINEMAEDEVSNFTHLIITFLNLLKSNNYSINEVAEKNRKLFQGQEQKRNEIFLELFTPIYIKYNEHLKSIPTIDFSDMINHATEYISSEIVNLKYRYIIVDEYQDISISRYKLLKSIRDKNPGSKVYCVGDDWQSIFRFSGSDISLFTEFEKYFGVTEKSYIETTYRFNSRLINISSAFILKNPNQIRKKLISYNNEDFVPYEIHYTESNDNDDTTPVIESLNSIQNELNDQNKTCKILALGRYGYDIDFLKKDISNFTVVWNQSIESYKIQYNLYKNLEIEFLTVHRAKGLEADYVLLLNCNSGKYGFPSEQADDPILNLILTRADQFPNGEERRLFYVAMTRCSRKVFMITKAKYKSKFIIELENDNSVLLERKCPFCKTGRLIETSGTSYEGLPWRNLTCSNWNWGCDYLEWIN